MNKQQKFMDDHELHDHPLKELVSKGLWKPAIQACDEAIDKRKADVVRLVELKMSLTDEVEDDRYHNT